MDDYIVGSNAQISAGEEGGFLWQKRSVTKFTYLQVVNAHTRGAGAAIYVDGSDGMVGDSSDQETQKHDSITFGAQNRTVRIVGDNESQDNKGIVVIGTYSDLFFGGKVQMWDHGLTTIIT